MISGYWWYISRDLPQDADLIVIEADEVYYGYRQEPDYKTIEQYDLRLIGRVPVHDMLIKSKKI